MNKSLLRTFGVLLLTVVVVLLMPGTTFAAGARWHGLVGGDDPNVRSTPSTKARTVGALRTGDPLTVQGWVKGEMAWGSQRNLGADRDGGGRVLGAARQAASVSSTPAPRTFPGHWIDVNLTEQISTAG